MITTTFSNGQQLISSALTTSQCESIFQSLVCKIFGLIVLEPITIDFVAQGSNQIQLPQPNYLQIGYLLNDYNPITANPASFFPANTVITAIEGNTCTLSNPSNLTNVNVNLFATEPSANTKCRIAWNTEGAPAWSVGQDVISIQCIHEESTYTSIRDRVWQDNDESSLIQQDMYSNAWRVEFVGRGPDAFNSIQLIRTSLVQDFSHDMLATSNLYLVPELSRIVRTPENFEGQWWEVTTFHAKFFEQVNESLIVPSIASAEIIVENQNGLVADYKTQEK